MTWPAVPPQRGVARDSPSPTSDSPPHPGAAASETESLLPEHRERIEKLLEATEEELLDRLGREIAPLETAAPALWFVSSNERFLPLALRLALRVVCRHLGPESYRHVARRFLRRNRSLFRLRICVGWNYCGRRHSPDVLDRPRLASTLASFISHLIVGATVSSELVAALLVKQDLDKLCRCKKERSEGGTS
jgi:hypothetical protein